MSEGNESTFPPTFPPSGWLTSRQAAERLGVSLETLTCGGWKWHSMLRGTGRCVRIPQTGGRCNIYSVEAVERIIAAREAAPPPLPEGFVDRDGACRFFGVPRHTWKKWVVEGRADGVPTMPSPRGGNRRLYSVEGLERMKREQFGEHALYKGADHQWRVPAGMVRREDAWELFGVGMVTWERWEREGKITCGQRTGQGPKLYALSEIMKLLAEHGKLTPPYPDPMRPGCWRVPLGGRDIRRREAIVDADTLPLIEGGICTWSQTGKFGFVSFYSVDGPKRVPLRRIILGVEGRGAQIGHANDDPLDCRRENLVVRTVSERCRHMRKATVIAGKAPSSRFKGVFWESFTKKWRASIGVNGKNRKLGRFGDEIAAALAYDEAARQWFGEHARLNFPDGVEAWVEQQRAEWEKRDEAAAERQAA